MIKHFLYIPYINFSIIFLRGIKMKDLLLPFLAVFIYSLTILTFAQENQHIPPCQSIEHGTISEGACWGYAVGRAFNRGWSDTYCPNSTLVLTGVPETYFQWYEPFNIYNIQVGDIVAWGSKGYTHVAFITAINSRNNDGIILADRYNTGDVERTNKTLTFLVNERGGNPTGYFRKKKLWSIRVSNKVDGSDSIGTVAVYGPNVYGQYISPKTVTQLSWESNFRIDAVFDGSLYNDYIRRFKRWEDAAGNLRYPSKSYPFSVKNYNFNTTQYYIAQFNKEYNVTFKNNFVSVGNIGSIIVNGTQYNNLPISSFPVQEKNTITATAINQVINGISYNFVNWSDNSTSMNKTFTPTDHSVYTANFVGKPSNNNRNLSANSVVNQPVILYWNDNINSNVTYYQIWRYSKSQYNGLYIYEQIAAVNRGIQTYTDYDFKLTSGYTDFLLKYDVRGYYSIENTFADPDYSVARFGAPLEKSNETNDTLSTKISGYEISCFPNPFNPTTTLKYQLPKAGHTILKIYNELGREIKTLVNQYQTEGKYEEVFNASDLASGVYYYSLTSEDYYKSGKLLLIK